MSEENNVSQATTDQQAEAELTTTDVVMDWEKKYQEEVRSSKSYRQRAQTAEGKLEKQEKETESTRKKKMEEDGKLKELISEQGINQNLCYLIMDTLKESYSRKTLP